MSPIPLGGVHPFLWYRHRVSRYRNHYRTTELFSGRYTYSGVYIYRTIYRTFWYDIHNILLQYNIGAGRSHPASFPRIFLFCPRKTGKAGKTGNISKVWKFNRGKNIWKASYSNIRKKKSGNLDKKSFDKNGPYIIRYTLSNYQV